MVYPIADGNRRLKVEKGPPGTRAKCEPSALPSKSLANPDFERRFHCECICSVILNTSTGWYS